MTDTTSDPDVIFNRLNIALARSQRILNSWVPPKSEANKGRHEDDDLPEAEFKSMNEKSGLESKAAYADDDDLPDGAVQRKKLASNDKLLEQLLGSKAAQAKKKSKEPGKSMSTSRHTAPKQLTTRSKAPREVDSEEDDEGGRAAAFKSKQPIHHRKSSNPDTAIEDERLDVQVDSEQVTATRNLKDDESSPGVPSGTLQNSTKRKPTSYLDEMLAQRANKKSRKKKKSKIKQIA
jgi:hypothetical protein